MLLLVAGHLLVSHHERILKLLINFKIIQKIAKLKLYKDNPICVIKFAKLKL